MLSYLTRNIKVYFQSVMRESKSDESNQGALACKVLLQPFELSPWPKGKLSEIKINRYRR